MRKVRFLSNPFLVGGLLFVSTFCLSMAALATTWPGTWPDCGWGCWQYGPDGPNSNPDSCENCCNNPTTGCGRSTGPYDLAACVACCNSYNYGNPNGNTHCQGHGPIPAPPASVNPYGP
ncbi:MAG TPA: hypothetical protein VKU00_33205 [Chthonomonadaceae bacterium]|nr:hypothetical protein [Chthonomonadaceae bacterium]